MGIGIIRLLPTLMFSKYKINGKKIDYERYILEIINLSEYFMNITGGEKFKMIAEQAHGEADVKTSNYELDFKLLVNPSFINNKLKSLPNVNYDYLKNGVIVMNEKTKTTMTQAQANAKFVRFYSELFKLTKEQIANYENDNESDFYSTIKMLKKEKNLLIFLPFEIECENETGVINTVVRLNNLFSLRDGIKNDTYLIVLRKQGYSLDEFYILKYENCEFKIIDKVLRLLITSFNDIYKLTSFRENN